SFTQLGFITFTLNMIASVIQPIIGTYTDKNPTPFALPIGLRSSMMGMFVLTFALVFGLSFYVSFLLGLVLLLFILKNPICLFSSRRSTWTCAIYLPSSW